MGAVMYIEHGPADLCTARRAIYQERQISKGSLAWTRSRPNDVSND